MTEIITNPLMRARVVSGISRPEMAKICGMSVNTLGRRETESPQKLTLEQYARMCAAVNDEGRGILQGYFLTLF